jgi:hypothetical protein
MFKKLLENFGKKHFLKRGKVPENKEVIDYGKIFANISTGLILLPDQLENFGIAINKQKEIMNFFPNTKFVYIVREKHSSLIPNELQNRVIPIHQNNLNPFGVPNRRFLKNVLKDRFDIIIDLNAEFDYVSTYISKKARATLRICLCHPERDPFYNLQVCTSKEQPLDQQISIMLEYVARLIAPSARSPESFLPA